MSHYPPVGSTGGEFGTTRRVSAVLCVVPVPARRMQTGASGRLPYLWLRAAVIASAIFLAA